MEEISMYLPNHSIMYYLEQVESLKSFSERDCESNYEFTTEESSSCSSNVSDNRTIRFERIVRWLLVENDDCERELSKNAINETSKDCAHCNVCGKESNLVEETETPFEPYAREVFVAHCFFHAACNYEKLANTLSTQNMHDDCSSLTDAEEQSVKDNVNDRRKSCAVCLKNYAHDIVKNVDGTSDCKKLTLEHNGIDYCADVIRDDLSLLNAVLTFKPIACNAVISAALYCSMSVDTWLKKALKILCLFCSNEGAEVTNVKELYIALTNICLSETVLLLSSLLECLSHTIDAYKMQSMFTLPHQAVNHILRSSKRYLFRCTAYVHRSHRIATFRLLHWIAIVFANKGKLPCCVYRTGLTLLCVMLQNIAHDVKNGSLNAKAEIFAEEMVEVLKETILPRLQEFENDKSWGASNLQEQESRLLQIVA